MTPLLKPEMLLEDWFDICRVFIYYCHGLHSTSWRNSFVSLQLGELVEHTVCWGSVQSARTKSCYWPAVGSCYPACREAFRTSQAPATKLLGHQCTPHSVLLSPSTTYTSGTLSLGGVFVSLFFGGGLLETSFHYVAPASNLQSSASASQVLGLQAHPTIPGHHLMF